MSRLEEAIRRIRGRKPKGVDLAPSSPFDALLDERMKHLEQQLGELKGRVNGLIFAVVGAVVLQLVLGIIR